MLVCGRMFVDFIRIL